MPAAKKGDYDKARERTKAGTNVTGSSRSDGAGGSNNNRGTQNKSVTISKSTGKVTYGPAAAPRDSSVTAYKEPKGFFSAGKAFVNSVRNNFGRGPSSGRLVTDPKTGKTYVEPEYRAFSLQGLTSKDPANVARNREAAARYAALDAERLRNRSDREGQQQGGLMDLLKKNREEKAATETPPLTTEQIAAIGAPNTPMAPVEVATPVYGLPSVMQPPSVQPVLGYGSAFTQMPLNYGAVNYLDIFGQPADPSLMYR